MHSVEVTSASKKEGYNVLVMQFGFHFCLGACSVEVAMEQQLGLGGDVNNHYY